MSSKARADASVAAQSRRRDGNFLARGNPRSGRGLGARRPMALDEPTSPGPANAAPENTRLEPGHRRRRSPGTLSEWVSIFCTFPGTSFCFAPGGGSCLPGRRWAVLDSPGQALFSRTSVISRACRACEPSPWPPFSALLGALWAVGPLRKGDLVCSSWALLDGASHAAAAQPNSAPYHSSLSSSHAPLLLFLPATRHHIRFICVPFSFTRFS